MSSFVDMTNNYQFDIELNKLMEAVNNNETSAPATLEQLLKLKHQQQQLSASVTNVNPSAMLARELKRTSRPKVDPLTGMPLTFPERTSPPLNFNSQQFDYLNVAPNMDVMQMLMNSKQRTNVNPAFQGFPKKIYKTNNDNGNDILNLLTPQQLGLASTRQPITKGRQIVKQNHWPIEPEVKSASNAFSSGRTGCGENSFGQKASPLFRNGSLDTGMFGNDFGGEFSAPTAPRDIFSQAAAAANSVSSNATSSASFPIGTFTMDSTTSGKDRNIKRKMDGEGGMTGFVEFGFGNANGNESHNPSSQETGIIEKLLHSYGFIQCCERQARLFFHFSQFCGNIEHVKIGDPVEFEMTYDRRTGKPIACSVKKIAPDVVMSEERVTGTVTTEIKTIAPDGTVNPGSENSNITTGRISYENRGECFFLPYTKEDIEGNVLLCSGDKVSFQVATNQRGHLGACHIRLENPVHPVKYRGVVCSMKESFGFIERADVVKEIFFHFSEAENSMELRPGDDVEFIIQTRNGKEVACNLTRLTPGSVIFEDVGTQIFKGQVLKPLDRNNPLRQVNDPLPGRIRYRAADHSEVEVPFGDKDQKGDFTLRHGDWVQFLLATDRRDSLQRATSISLLDETFEVSGEKREQGVVSSLKEGFGYIRGVERSSALFFHFAEVLDTCRAICVDDEVEFTVIQDPTASSFSNKRQNAIRIKHLPEGTVEFEILVESGLTGIVTREAPKSPVRSLERTEGGVISYGGSDELTKKTVVYFLKDCDRTLRVGDQVRFNICQVKRNKELIAVNIKDANAPLAPVVEKSDEISTTTNVNDKAAAEDPVLQGFIVVLKENFGFIECVELFDEIFFHFSNVHGNTNNLEVGQEVEFVLSRLDKYNSLNFKNCLPAEYVKVLPKGSIERPTVLETVYTGVVDRPMHSTVFPVHDEYFGLINKVNEENTIGSPHYFGMFSLVNPLEVLQRGDKVTFKVDVNNWAAEVTPIRVKNRATVDSLKGPFGFLDYEVEEGKKLFFHMSEVQGNVNNLHNGDTVEFTVLKNQRSGKTSACNVVKVLDGASMSRPERIFSRLKINSVDESVPKLIVIRTPKGPDGTRGFAAGYRIPHAPGIIEE